MNPSRDDWCRYVWGWHIKQDSVNPLGRGNQAPLGKPRSGELRALGGETYHSQLRQFAFQQSDHVTVFAAFTNRNT